MLSGRSLFLLVMKTMTMEVIIAMMAIFWIHVSVAWFFVVCSCLFWGVGCFFKSSYSVVLFFVCVNLC